MPQCRQGSRDAGLLIPGAYRAMLDYERAKYERRGEVLEIDGRELRVSWANEDDHAQGFPFGREICPIGWRPASRS